MEKLVIVVVLIALIGGGVLFFLQQKPDAPTTSIAALAEKTPEAVAYKQLYPDAITMLRKEGCTDGYLKFLKATDAMLIGRDPVSCDAADKYDWMVEYKVNRTARSGVMPALTVAVDRQGKLIDSIYTSPFDDAYLIVYDGIYGAGLPKKLNTGKITFGQNYGTFEKDNVGYIFSVSTFPSTNQTGIILSIENYKNYKLSTTSTLKQDISDSHALFKSGANDIVKVLQDSASLTPSGYQFAVYP